MMMACVGNATCMSGHNALRVKIIGAELAPRVCVVDLLIKIMLRHHSVKFRNVPFIQ